MKSKSLLLLLLMALFAPLAMNAQTTVEIGDGTTASYYAPIGTLYNYSITEQLYTAEEIGMAGTIQSISFNYALTEAKDFPIQVYMKNVDAADLSTGISLADADLVFDGTYSVLGQGWATITLTTPFEYDGTSNLLIGVNKGYVQWFSGSTWYYTTATNMTRYSQQDSSGYDNSVIPGVATGNRPNIRLEIVAGSGPYCAKPTGVEVEYNGGTTATVSWNSDASNFKLRLNGTEISNVSNPHTLTGLALGTTYSVEVKAVCGGSNGESDWTTPKTFTTDFCMPEEQCNLTFVLTDTYGDGWNGNAIQIKDVTTGTIVATLANQNLDGVNGEETQTVTLAVCDGRALEFSWVAGSYPGETQYTVTDINNEVVLEGSGAFETFTFTPNCTPVSCARPDDLAVTYNGGTTAEVSWTSEATAWNIDLNGTIIPVTTNPYTLTGLELSTVYSVSIQANCGSNGLSNWTNPVSFHTDLCMPENQCAINLILTDSYGDSWNGNAIQVVDAETQVVLGEFTNQNLDGTNGTETQTYTCNVCEGRLIQFVWVKGSYPGEASWVITDINDEEITSGTGTTSMVTGDVLGEYMVSCVISTCRRPTNLAGDELGSRSIKLSWTENGEATEWVVAYKTSSDDKFVEVDASTNPFTLSNLTPETSYTVKVRPVCDDSEEKWSNLFPFTTDVACPAPAELAITNLMPTSVSVTWTSDANGFELEYGTFAEIVSGELTYGTDEYGTNVGLGGGQFQWGVMFPAGTYTADLMKVSVYDCMAMTGTLYLYNDGTTAPESQVASAAVTLTGANKFVDFYISADLDLTKNLWIVFDNESGATYPGAACYITDEAEQNANGRWVAIQGAWYDISDVGLDATYHWLIKAIFGTADVVWTSVPNPTSPCNITGLEPESDYMVQVRANCDEEGYSAWATTNFTTPGICDEIENFVVEPSSTTAALTWTGYQEMYNIRYRTAQSGDYSFFDDFEDGNLDGWTIYTEGEIPSSATAGWYAFNPYSALSITAHNGSSYAASAWSWSSSAFDADNWLVSPQVELGGILKFYAYVNQGYPDKFEVLLSTGGNTIDDFTITLRELAECPVMGSGVWAELEFDLSAYQGQQGYVAIHHVDYDANYLLIDDFGIMSGVIPAGPWIETQSESPEAVLEGLDPETVYEVQVQGVCSKDETTEWTDLVTFTTTAICGVIPELTTYQEVTDNSIIGIDWSAGGDNISWNLRYRPYLLPDAADGTLEDPEHNALVTLYIPSDVWGDGSGYQMLLDADANAFGTIIPESGPLTSSGDASDEVYAEFEYKIPVDADGSLTTENILVEGSISIEIPAGTYDWCVTNPTPGDRLWIATDGRADDYTFEAGKDYTFMVYMNGQNDDVELMQEGGEWITVETDQHPYNITGLEPNTFYEIQVQGVCQDGYLSEWSAAGLGVQTLEAQTPSEIEQEMELSGGWNWISSYVECTSDLFDALKDGIAENNATALIKNMSFATMLQGGTWSDSELEFENEFMYMANLESATTVTLTAAPADPAAHPITLSSGWNWIGFVSAEEIEVNEALASLTPTNGDLIKNMTGASSYNGTEWQGSLENMMPGNGYMYFNNGAQMTLTYPASAKGVVRSLPVEKYWSTNVHEHATNLVLMATLDEAQFAMTNGNYEIGAFVGDECRGSARLQKAGNGYVAFVVIHGDSGETVSFKLYDVMNAKEVGASVEQLNYVSNAIRGSVEEPMVLHFRGLTDVNEDANSLSVFPNPAKDNLMIQGQAIETVSVYNTLGQCLLSKTYEDANSVELNMSGFSAGVYTVSIRTNGTMVTKMIVKE